jgi:hypothetical protein
VSSQEGRCDDDTNHYLTMTHSLAMSSQESRCDDDTNHYLTITHSLAMCLAKKVDVMMTPTTT